MENKKALILLGNKNNTVKHHWSGKNEEILIENKDKQIKPKGNKIMCFSENRIIGKLGKRLKNK